MIMFAEKFSHLISDNSQDSDALRRVAEYFFDFEIKHGDRVYKVKLDPARLFDISGAGSVSRLARITSLLLNERILERRVVVRFPSGAGHIFVSYADIPETIRDPVRDIEVEVTTDVLESLYVPVH